MTTIEWQNGPIAKIDFLPPYCLRFPKLWVLEFQKSKYFKVGIARKDGRTAKTCNLGRSHFSMILVPAKKSYRFGLWGHLSYGAGNNAKNRAINRDL